MKQLIFIFFLFTLSLQAQFQVSGIVKDAETKRALPFATITTENGTATISDVDGKFNLLLSILPESLTISYVGYQSKTISLFEQIKYFTIELSPKVDALKEVVVANVNQANTIIAKVIRNKNANNPQKKLKTFQYKTYNKILVSADPDSISGKIDTVFVDDVTKDKVVKIDSTDYKFKKIIDKQHLFLTEKVSLFQYEKPLLKETIIGIKMAGFKEPIYELLGLGLQSASVYEDKYELFETKYKSPIAAMAEKEYRYKILDTTSIGRREVIVIYFKNKISR
jgi:hypothetical protein